MGKLRFRPAYTSAAIGMDAGGGLGTITSTGFDWFVDSVLGNDANTGHSPAQAFQTITALEAAGISAGDKVGLARGSHWREQLDISVSGVTVEAYGSGAVPLLDCSDVAPNASFVATGGTANVYEIVVSPEFAPSGGWVNVWEDGAFLTRAANVAACDAAPGSYFPSSDAVAPITLYVHASDSSNVTANGKVYEYTQRLFGVNAADDTITLKSIRARRNLSESGSAKVGRSSVLTDCIFEDGNKHNVLVADGSKLTGCTVSGSYYGGATASLAVYNENTPASLGVSFTNCAFSMPTKSTTVSGIEGHFNVSGDFGPVVVQSCTFNLLNTAVVCNDFTSLLVDSCTFTECGGVLIEEAATPYTISNCTMSAPVAQVSPLVSTNVAGAVVTVSDTTVLIRTTPNGIANILHNNTTLTVTDCDFEGTGFGAATGVLFINTGKTGCVITVNNSRIVLNTGSNYRFLAAPTYTGDFNTFSRGGGQPRYNLGAATYTTLVDWQTAVAPEDANSVVA